MYRKKVLDLKKIKLYNDTTKRKNTKEGIMEKRRYEDQIDLMEVFFAIKRRILIILATAFLCGTAAFCYSKYMITPLYTSTASILVLTKETTLTSMADLQLGSQLKGDYQILLTSRSVLEQVIENMDLNTGYGALRGAIRVENPADTRIMRVSVTNADPVLAKDIVNELVQVAAEYIGETMNISPPKIIEEGIVPTAKTSPDNRDKAMKGFLLGFVLSAGIVVLLTLLDDTIKNEEDIEKYLGIPMLASIPDRKDYVTSPKKGSRAAMKNKLRKRKGK